MLSIFHQAKKVRPESVLEDSDNDVIVSLLLPSCTFLLKTDTEIESVNIYVAHGFPSSATSNTGYKRIMPAGKSQAPRKGVPGAALLSILTVT